MTSSAWPTERDLRRCATHDGHRALCCVLWVEKAGAAPLLQAQWEGDWVNSISVAAARLTHTKGSRSQIIPGIPNSSATSSAPWRPNTPTRRDVPQVRPLFLHRSQQRAHRPSSELLSSSDGSRPAPAAAWGRGGLCDGRHSAEVEGDQRRAIDDRWPQSLCSGGRLEGASAAGAPSGASTQTSPCKDGCEQSLRTPKCPCRSGGSSGCWLRKRCCSSPCSSSATAAGCRAAPSLPAVSGHGWQAPQAHAH